MSLNVSRSAAGLSRQALRRCRNRQLSPSSPVTSTASHIKPRDTTTAPSSSRAAFSTSTPRRETAAAAASGGSDREKPRWSYTPERMIAPFSPHITKNPARRHWEVNNDPKKLDAALTKFLGRDGDRLLPEELKWLAVTHKSFDQGRRGFNDRLAFLGRQICIMEATQSIITSPADFAEPPSDVFADRRQPFEDAELRSLDNLTSNQPNDLFSFSKLTKIAMDSGLTEVVRWRPKMPENQVGSGLEPVMAGAVFAIIGAVALQHGGKVASRVMRERVLRRVRP